MFKILTGDCRVSMRQLQEKSIDCCVTSPPYFSLRDYDMDGQIGLESTPEHYINELVSVFEEVNRVLKDEGTLWINIGDSYASFRDGKATPDTTRGNSQGTLVDKGKAKNRMASTFTGTDIKHKDLIGIPWMLAFALRKAGWYLRQDIIWQKPNPMPESVKDRCTKSHEYIFLFSKSEKYYYDHSASMELSIDGLSKRSRRSVWTVETKPFKGAHFATFPPSLIEPCILAGCPENGTVLDPFGGSGTTAVVANQNNRDCVLCELNPDYVSISETRLMKSVVTNTLDNFFD
jgi:site-specific DNA-methyltransferase (adenine-specific)